MLQIIQQLANEAGTTVEETTIIFTAISNLLISKIPPLAQIIEDIFENAEADKLKNHIRKLIIYLEEQQCKEVFGDWIPPQQNITRHQEQSKDLL
ncbi:MAG: hypothetical protein ACKVOW_17695 [Chitinophagaceae bacterium]